MPLPRQLVPAVALALAAAAAFAQPEDPPPAEPPPQARFGERVEVTEVLLDVVVTDRKGRVVAGLGPDDFGVEEAGERMEVTSVTFHPHRAAFEAAPGADPMAALPDPGEPLAERLFILFFHEEPVGEPLVQRQFLALGRWMDRWVETELGFNDRVAVVNYTSGGLRVWTDFTNDRRRIVDAVEAVSLGDRAFGNRPTRDPRGRGPSLLDHLPRGRELRRRTLRVHGALQVVAEACRGTAGRKNLLLFSLGFGRPPEPGFPNWIPDSRYYPPMMEALNGNNVAVYAVDLLSTVEQGSLQDRGLNQSLAQLADDTGGEYYFHFTDFLQPLREIEEATTGYYVLSYRTEVPAGESGFRPVEVKVPGRKLRAAARRGYRFGDEPVPPLELGSDGGSAVER